MTAPGRSRLIAAVLVLGLLVLPVVASGVAVWRAAHTDEASRIDHAEAIIVFGAAQYGGVPSPTFRGRLDHGALLYRGGFGDRILVVGAGQPGDEFTEAEAGAAYLVEEGIPSDVVTPSPEGTTTFESLQGAAELMREIGVDSAFLVSDPWHNLRIKRMARDLGIEGYVSATWQSAARSQRTRLQGYLRETFAYLYYRALGR
ncbi:MAG TPA: YdcF family protein [Actinomycetota bacterium]|nr:YdcF family protein [Actinomycetota bacterium]